eukprot:2361200-Rhodomonas_salina.1
MTGVKTAAAGGNLSMAIMEDGEVFIWGSMSEKDIMRSGSFPAVHKQRSWHHTAPDPAWLSNTITSPTDKETPILTATRRRSRVFLPQPSLSQLVVARVLRCFRTGQCGPGAVSPLSYPIICWTDVVSDVRDSGRALDVQS